MHSLNAAVKDINRNGMTSLELKNIYDRLSEARSSERFRLKRVFDRLKKRNPENNPEWDALKRDIELSVRNKSD